MSTHWTSRYSTVILWPVEYLFYQNDLFNSQVCEYYAHSQDQQVILHWFQAGAPLFRASNLDYTASISFTNASDSFTAFLQMRIDLKRKFSRDFIETVCPAGLLVFVSWVRWILSNQRSIQWSHHNWTYNFTYCRSALWCLGKPFRVGWLFWSPCSFV